ncbi:hypothetical protein LU631_00825 [Erwinia tracheiphila]|uniref:Uncharacterized protein n=1 Tax=Erwinia tracheiphila TaxID=65700 RepID=A0A0M2KBI5_9GAMM|nr:hypothetical protein [Erwinia tracheiphila]AXF77653.1 hypothetical protein AV903_18945 [Erwinia tracheiphila]EOS94392.1 hypothetical protein ETR_13901 [Erwinia tracheiphila PSU-1]KKF36720.1 hypothetical protein SY86_16900 [Erwinia tracheiphila]UIA83659.1 hypothetical protein LU604_00405 [Erwinia tracheiphila]UIA88055.1 hypothetical protein LU631_00825 [Erwinia tracheiphila]
MPIKSFDVHNHYHNTGTSKRVTEAILVNPDTVRQLTTNLKTITNNNGFFNPFTTSKHVEKLEELTNARTVDPGQIQVTARNAKHFFRDNYNNLLNSLNSTGGRIHDNSQASQDLQNAYHAYQITKSIQNNDNSLLLHSRNIKPLLNGLKSNINNLHGDKKTLQEKVVDLENVINTESANTKTKLKCAQEMKHLLKSHYLDLNKEVKSSSKLDDNYSKVIDSSKAALQAYRTAKSLQAHLSAMH